MRAKPLSLLTALLLAACGSPGGKSPSPSPSLSGNLTVLAAASLTEAFGDLGREFGIAHPSVRTRFSFGGSPTLATQILQGAPADVFASADQPNMQKVVAAGLAAGTPQVFGRNRLQVVVRAGNPEHVTSLADLGRSNLRVVLCAPAVPCGAYARTALARAGVKVTPRSEEDNVRAVVTKVALGEADAGIVYVTDVRAAGDQVQGIDIPDAYNVVASYPLVALRNAPNPSAARAFVDFVLSPLGQRVLRAHGFASP